MVAYLLEAKACELMLSLIELNSEIFAVVKREVQRWRLWHYYVRIYQTETKMRVLQEIKHIDECSERMRELRGVCLCDRGSHTPSPP